MTLAALLAAGGCADPIPTADLYAEFSVVHDREGLQAYAVLNRCETVEGTGGVRTCRESVPLAGGDALWVEVEDEWYRLEPGNVANYYGVDLPPFAPGTEFRFALDRDHAESAISSKTTLPPPFTLTGAPETVSRASDGVELDLALPSDWDRYTGLWELWTCDNMGEEGQTDWQFDRAADRLWAEPGTMRRPPHLVNQPPECEVSVTLSLSISGQIDPAFAGGWVSGKQKRSVSFTSVP